MKKSFIISWCLIFVVFFLTPHFLGGFIETPQTPNMENRVMAELPELNLSTIDTFPIEFESYYNDNLPFRSFFIEVNSFLNYMIFNESSDPRVIIGRDNWLFFNPDGQDGDPMGDFYGETYLSDNELECMAKNLIEIESKLSEQGKEFVVMVAPNKESIYGNLYLPTVYQSKGTNTTADQVVEYLKETTKLRIVYPKDELLNAISEFPQYDFYYNTDSHWNYLGGYIGAKCLIKELGGDMEDVTSENVFYEAKSTEGRDLVNMMGLSNHFFEENDYRVMDNPDSNIISSSMDFFTECRFDTDSTNEKKLFIIRDSYCTQMAEYIAPYFSSSVMIHKNYYEPYMLDAENPDIVVYQVVERHIRLLSDFTIEVE